LICAVALIRWLLLRGTPYPTGLDGGNWLAFGHAIFGEHLRSSTLLYPPVVPLAAVISEGALGTYLGVKVLAFIAATAPAVGAYVLLHTWGLRWRAAMLAGLLAASAGTGEAMAWGGYPQLIGLGLLPLFILALDRFLRSRRISTAIAPAVLLIASLATNEFIGPLTVVIGLLYLIPRYALIRPKEQRNSLRNVLLGVGLSVVLALPLVPLYFGLIQGVVFNERLKAAAAPANVSAWTGLGAATADLPIFWLVALALAVLAPLILIARHERLSLLSAAILYPSLVILVITGENRLAYLLPIGVVFGLAAWWQLMSRLPSWSNRAFSAAVVTSLAIDIVVGTQFFAHQRDQYLVLTPGVVHGFTVLKRSSADQLIAISPTKNDWPIGWWVEGAVHRRTIYAGNPVWLTYSDEKVRNSLANSVFASGKSPIDSARRAHDVGAAYLFVDKKWPGYASWIARGQHLDPRMLVYENESVVIIDTGVLGT
jgi:hypothetical protein